jgi:hypothetical protein
MKLNNETMIKRLIFSVLTIILMAGTGCMKDTYDFKMLSKKAQLSPTLAMSAVKGSLH